jgi:hypothetical protein
MPKTNVLTPARLAAVLKKVPEKKFRITGLAPQLLTRGKVDIAKCMERQQDIDLAVIEVRTYIDGVNSLRHALIYFNSWYGEDMAEEDFADDEYNPYTDPNRDEAFL